MTGSLEQLQITFPSTPTPERPEPPPAAHLFPTHLSRGRTLPMSACRRPFAEETMWRGPINLLGYSDARLVPSTRQGNHSMPNTYFQPYYQTIIPTGAGRRFFPLVRPRTSRPAQWSDCLLCQAFCATGPAQLNAARASRARAFSRTNNLCAKATRITLLGFPLAAIRSANAAKSGL